MAAAAAPDPGALPRELTSFVGRRHELGGVRRLLADNRFVTLTGPGGTGKTRLALRAADGLRRAFRNGVWFVDLSEVRLGSEQAGRQGAPDAQAPAALAYAVLAALGLTEGTDQHPARLLTLQLADADTLLVLDNCEHLLGACQLLVKALLQGCPQVRILATSRERLDVPGETTSMVPPLAVPAPGPAPTPSDLLRRESVALFVARAQAAMPSFTLTEANSAAVASLCRELEGLPLAIELAAVHIRALPPDQILDRITDRFTLLRRGLRTAPQRQRTLRACVDWSHDLCTPQEQLLWHRLSVFAGSFDPTAAEHICADDALPAEAIPAALAGLVDKSILATGVGTPPRYRMLETIRQYGRQQLPDTDAQARLQQRHADWYLRLAEDGERTWFGPDQIRVCRRMRAEHANLRAALEHYLAVPGDPARASGAVRLASALWFYWLIFGLVREGRDWLGRALAAPSGDGVPAGRARAKALWVDGHLATVHGDLAAAIERLETARELADRFADRLTGARSLKRLGGVAMHRGDQALAEKLLRQSLHRLTVQGPEAEASIAHARVTLALSRYLAGDLAGSVAVGLQNRQACRQRGDHYVLAHVLNCLARAELALGDPDAAAGHAREALELWRALRGSVPVSYSLDLLTWITAAAGDHERAATLLGAAAGAWHHFGRNVQRWDFHEQPRQEWIRRIQDALGPERYAEAGRRGAGMSPDEIVACALGGEDHAGRRVAAPDRWLTRREAEVAELVARGLSNQQIADELVVARRTAEGHVQQIMRKLGFRTRSQIAAWVLAREPAPSS